MITEIIITEIIITEIIMVLIACYLITSFTFIFYVAAMHFKKVRSELNLTMKIIAAPALVVGIAIYFSMNLIVGSILFLEIPRTLQFTSRCERHIKKGSGWRYKQAMWWCKILGIFEENHCKGV